jgi:adenylate kinase
MEEAYAKSKTLKFNSEDWMTDEWAKIKTVNYGNLRLNTGAKPDTVKRIGELITKLPKDSGAFHP